MNFRTGTFLQETPQELKNRDYFRRYHTTRPLRHSSSSPALHSGMDPLLGKSGMDPLLAKAVSCADLGRRPTLYDIVQEATRASKPRGYIRKGLRLKLAARAEQARAQIQQKKEEMAVVESDNVVSNPLIDDPQGFGDLNSVVMGRENTVCSEACTVLANDSAEI